VTVTVARPNMRSIGPRSVSTVCTRDIGAIRRSWVNHPVRVYTAVSLIFPSVDAIPPRRNHQNVGGRE